MIVSRRTWGRLIFGAAFGRAIFPPKAKAATSNFHVDRLLVDHPVETVSDQVRGYRADAVVSLLSVPIFSRAGVGSGFCSYREARQGNVSVTTSRFAGGSFPKRARNLNRLGFIEEVVVSGESGPTEAAYFGFMTSSPEEGISEAKKSLEATRDSVPYVAAEGMISRKSFKASKVRFAFPSSLTWADRANLLQQVRSEFAGRTPETREVDLSGKSWAGTLLHALATAVKQHPTHFQAGYVYNAKQFDVKLEKASDPKSASAFAAKHLTSRPESVALFRGIITDHLTGKLTKFRFWTEENGTSLLPIRIELQARSFLSLAFEYDPAVKVDGLDSKETRA